MPSSGRGITSSRTEPICPDTRKFWFGEVEQMLPDPPDMASHVVQFSEDREPSLVSAQDIFDAKGDVLFTAVTDPSLPS